MADVQPHRRQSSGEYRSAVIAMTYSEVGDQWILITFTTNFENFVVVPLNTVSIVYSLGSSTVLSTVVVRFSIEGRLSKISYGGDDDV